MTYKEQCEQLVFLTKDIFPEHAEIETWYDGSRMSAICRIFWKLSNDKNRPNKSSKIIFIVIPNEALDDYSESTANKKQRAQERFKQHIQNKYRFFDPNYDIPEHQGVPSEEWLITTSFLNE